jgi:hypothetical protein
LGELEAALGPDPLAPGYVWSPAVVYDLYYRANLGPWLDARLILVTAAKVFGLAGLVRVLLGIPGPAQVERGSTATAETTEITVVSPSRVPIQNTESQT